MTMNSSDSNMAANAIAHAATMAGETWKAAAYEYERPVVAFRPKLSRDGNMWCFLLGDNLQEGVAGFGETPCAASYAFDLAFNTERAEECRMTNIPPSESFDSKMLTIIRALSMDEITVTEAFTSLQVAHLTAIAAKRNEIK